MLLGVLEAFPPIVRKKDPRAVDFADVASRKRVRDYAPILRKIAWVSKPYQRMCRYISEHIDTAQNVHPPYRAYVTVTLRALPWMAPGACRERTIEAFWHEDGAVSISTSYGNASIYSI